MFCLHKARALKSMHGMAAVKAFSALMFGASGIFGLSPSSRNFVIVHRKSSKVKPLLIEARNNARIESPKIRNRRTQKKFNGTQTKPRLSVFCSDKQLYAMLVDDKNKKCLFYGSTLQKYIRGDPPCTNIEAAKRVGEELIKASIELNIKEISYYDRNGLASGEKMQAFEIAIAQHGFLPR